MFNRRMASNRFSKTTSKFFVMFCAIQFLLFNQSIFMVRKESKKYVAENIPIPMVKEEYLNVKASKKVSEFEFTKHPKPVYSSSHCFSSNLQENSWMTTACAVKNVCFNLTSRQFIYYRKPLSLDPGPDPVAITVINYRWGRRYDDSVKFIPEIRYEALPQAVWQSPQSDFYVIHESHVPHNPGHLLWDDYWTWFMLTASVYSRLESQQISIYPVWYNVNNDPPWATCDWIRQHTGPGHTLPASKAEKCHSLNERWLRTFLGPEMERPPETNTWVPINTSSTMEPPLVCLSSAIWGSGATSRNMGGHDGWEPNDRIPPTAGRGPLIESFRNHMVDMAGFGGQKSPQGKRIFNIFLAQYSSNRLKLDLKFHKKLLETNKSELETLARKVSGNDNVEVNIQAATLYKWNATEQIRVVSNAALYIGVAGGGAMTAQFLPPGAGMILYHQYQDHQGRDDWKIFGMYSPIRIRFIHADYVMDEALLLNTTKSELAASVLFMEDK